MTEGIEEGFILLESVRLAVMSMSSRNLSQSASGTSWVLNGWKGRGTSEAGGSRGKPSCNVLPREVMDKGGNGRGSMYGEIGRVKAVGGGFRGFLLKLEESTEFPKKD